MEHVIGKGPGAPLPPTLIYVAGFALAWWVESRTPLRGEDEPPALVGLAGWALVAAGSWLFLWGMATFSRMKTGIMLQQAATRVVEAPPYNWSRNPMYVAFTAIYVGLALALGIWWAFIFLPAVLVLLNVAVIAREERYMRATFGAAYEDYCRRVGRWF
jgi:protein-S-isoprenylcysteine O-methyltransferase Ste14